MMWTTKKALKEENAQLTDKLIFTDKLCNKVHDLYIETKSELDKMKTIFPLELGATVYEVQLRTSSGRFTKTKACRDKSTVTEVVVDKKNYFKLVDRYNANSVFKTLAEAVTYLDDICVD